MGDHNASTYRKLVRGILWSVEEAAPFAIACLILVLGARAVSYLLIPFGIKTTAPNMNSTEDVIFILALIVVPLLLRISRLLEEIVHPK